MQILFNCYWNLLFFLFMFLYDQSFYWTNYEALSIYIFVCLLLTVALVLISLLLATPFLSFEKSSAYECGFEQYSGSQNVIDAQFYLVAILFLIFDLEITILFPWIVHLYLFDIFQYFIVILFLFILTIGFIFEWKKGALDWI